MHYRKIAGLFFVLGMLVTASAYAEDAAPEAMGPMHDAKADTNKDGKISYDEFRAAHEKRMETQFKRMDTNGDGVIDEAEMQKMHEKMRDMRAKHKQPAP